MTNPEIERLFGNGAQKLQVRARVTVNGQQFDIWPEALPFFILLGSIDKSLGDILQELRRRPFVPVGEETE